jgi:hypothetical protein
MKHYMEGKARRLLPRVKTWVEFEFILFYFFPVILSRYPSGIPGKKGWWTFQKK